MRIITLIAVATGYISTVFRTVADAVYQIQQGLFDVENAFVQNGIVAIQEEDHKCFRFGRYL
jgi:hypothetical protein